MSNDNCSEYDEKEMHSFFVKLEHEAAREAEEQLKREGKKVSKWVYKQSIRHLRLTGEILEQKIATNPECSENFKKYLKNEREMFKKELEEHDFELSKQTMEKYVQRYNLQECVRNTDEISSGDSGEEGGEEEEDDEDETELEHGMRVLKMIDEGASVEDLLKKSFKRWYGIK